MALNIFGALGAVGRMLPGYVDGRERAIAANWNDLSQYNAAQRGQLDNSFLADTFTPRSQVVYDQARNVGLGRLYNEMNLETYGIGQDRRNELEYLRNNYDPARQTMAFNSELGQYNYDMNNLYGQNSRNWIGNAGVNGSAGSLAGVSGGTPTGGYTGMNPQQIQQRIQMLQQQLQQAQAALAIAGGSTGQPPTGI